jgi:ubiquinol-cytochrome c reductase cytochrome c subunit
MRRLALLTATLLAAGFGAAGGASAADAGRGRNLYFSACAQCHGPDLGGVDREARVGAGDTRVLGPPLRGVGAGAADFYLRTGYMPLRDPYEQPTRTHPAYSERDLRALVAFIGSFGGERVPRVHPERGETGLGLVVFTENCAGCHQVVGEGGIVTGARVPSLKKATATQIAEAVRVGPYVMPRFSERQISQHELDSLVRYVLYTREPEDRGGWALEHLGPVPEGIVAWLLAGGALLVVARLIGEGLRR